MWPLNVSKISRKRSSSRNTRLEVKLLSLLSLTPSAPRKSSTTLTSRLCVIHQLREPNVYFSSACGEESVRTWLEEGSRSLYDNVYLVCGFKTLTDAEITVSRSTGTDVDVSAGVSASLLTAASGVPLPILSDSGLDVSVGFSSANERSGTMGYTATGEHVYAVQYRKIKFSMFSSRKVEKAYLERGNRWKSYVGARAGDDVDDGIDVEISGPIDLPDLMGEYESLELDGGEKLLYRV
ncbi:hypothetical protein INS49_009829 [Diaporthe citri]|uniref:uncharacterized protein n=1 Tax=Diaporthe citri TaxID=83186 RepID=UPI001C7E3CFE|nr:uncharacterized protein INS49_009829 [Diaporthe citri]KAG6361602.1 hypothetical protein INS49_009829 [Diaporthe citri]